MNQRIGYASVSTNDRNLDLQRNALRLAEVEFIYEEAQSGKLVARQELDRCLQALKEGDTLVVWRLDRLARSLSELVRIVASLAGRRIGFESITEKIDTVSAAGLHVFHMFAALAEFERNVIRERTEVGLGAARARGRFGGRKPKLNNKQIHQIKILLGDPNTRVADLAREYGVSRATIYKHCGVVTPQSEHRTRG